MTSNATASAPDDLDARAAAGRDWALQQLDLAAATDVSFAPASADASFRRYFRISRGARSWVLMDAPPERENLEPFVAIARLSLDAGLNAPRVLAEDRVRGYLLLSDLGRQTFLHVLNAGNADTLMRDAIAALILWQRSSREGVLPPYDAALLQRELDLFPEWYVGRHLGRSLTVAQREHLTRIESLLIDSALAQPRVYVHRDYMPRNLMVSEPSPGVLDFQDAVYGPITYDVVCLFRDAFLSWPAERVEQWMHLYWQQAQAAGLAVHADFGEFRRAADWMGVQRHLKVIGIFARSCHCDGKPHYVADVPRFIRYVREVAGRYSELAPLVALFDELGMQA